MVTSSRTRLGRILLYVRIIVFGSLVAFGGYNFGIATTSRLHGKDVRLPASHWRGIDVDNMGRIYIGAHGDARIDVFDQAGEYVTRIMMPLEGIPRTFDFYIDANDTLRVAGKYKIYRFSLEGDLLEETKTTKKLYRKISDLSMTPTTDTEGNTYTIASHSEIYTCVIKIF